MPATATVDDRQRRIALAMSALHIRHFVTLHRHPRIEQYGWTLLQAVLTPMGYPLDPDATPHPTDANLLAILEITGMRHDCVPVAEFLEVLDAALLDPSSEMQASALYKNLSRQEVMTAISQAVSHWDISLTSFHCLFGIWLLLRAMNQGIITDIACS